MLRMHLRAFGDLVDDLPVVAQAEADQLQILGRIAGNRGAVIRVVPSGEHVFEINRHLDPRG